MSAIERGLSDIFLGQGGGAALLPIIGGTLIAFNTATGANTVFIASTGYTDIPFVGLKASSYPGPYPYTVLLIMSQLGPVMLGKLDHA